MKSPFGRVLQADVLQVDAFAQMAAGVPTAMPGY